MTREISSIHNHTCMSFSDGVTTPEELVQAAIDKGLKSIAVTDHGHCHSTGRVFLAAKAKGVKAILGSEAYVIDSLPDWRALKDKLNAERKANKAAASEEEAAGA